MISIVCVYNDERILREYLIKSLEDQTAEFELIKIDNTRNRFKSAAEALNHCSKKAKGKYIMFVHQDVDLYSNTWLEDAEKILDSIPDLGICGVAGISEEEYPYKTRGRNVLYFRDNILWPIGNPIQKPEPVQTLDECLIIIPRLVFERLPFDEKTCDGWHLYAVDYCLSVRKLGFGVYAIPMFISHKSMGGAKHAVENRLQIILSLGIRPKEYYRVLDKVLKKHKNHVKHIYTACGDWSTSYPLILQRIADVAKMGLEYFNRRIGIKK